MVKNMPPTALIPKSDGSIDHARRFGSSTKTKMKAVNNIIETTIN